MKELIESTRDIARELARKYSTSWIYSKVFLFAKHTTRVKSSLPRAIYVVNSYIFTKECSDNSTSRRTNNSQNI